MGAKSLTPEGTLCGWVDGRLSACVSPVMLCLALKGQCGGRERDGTAWCWMPRILLDWEWWESHTLYIFDVDRFPSGLLGPFLFPLVGSRA